MDETVTVLPPPAALAGAVVCCIWRRIEPGDSVGGRLQSHVPANVYGCVNLVAVGHVEIRGERPVRLPGKFITGPFTAPLPTFATAPLRSLSIVVHPWILREWFGVDVQSIVDAIQDIEQLSGDSVWEKSVGEKITAAISQPELLGEALAGLGVPESLAGRIEPRSLGSCLLSAGNVASAARTLGLSERQFERHFKRYMGLSPKLWLRIKRFEDALVSMAQAPDSGQTGLGDIAADTGFSDQAHMSRDFRAISGATPLTLRKGLHKGSPGYWAFQPANVGFLQDSQPSDK
jgi:AraC-like DNA-binding protein